MLQNFRLLVLVYTNVRMSALRWRCRTIMATGARVYNVGAVGRGRAQRDRDRMPVLTPQGSDSLAQGNALGWWSYWSSRLKAWYTPAYRTHSGCKDIMHGYPGRCPGLNCPTPSGSRAAVTTCPTRDRRPSTRERASRWRRGSEREWPRRRSR